MREVIFSGRDLEKSYRKRGSFKKEKILRGIRMEIYRGDIYGFVGPNGAGKTTLMRILTGRTAKSNGEMELFGKNEEREIERERGRIGALIETPAFFPNMTAWDNLEVLRIQKGQKARHLIEDALEMAGLSLDEARSKNVKYFSMGMKQRLGLAMAFFSNPDFLVLDEPINGLDPEGIVQFREVLKRLHKEKKTTMLISSHILSELDQLATCYGFIRNGKILEEITAEELQKKCRPCLSIFVDDVLRAAEILQKSYPECEAKPVSEHRIKLHGFTGNTGEVTKQLILDGISVIEIRAENPSLESYYLTLAK